MTQFHKDIVEAIIHALILWAGFGLANMAFNSSLGILVFLGILLYLVLCVYVVYLGERLVQYLRKRL